MGAVAVAVADNVHDHDHDHDHDRYSTRAGLEWQVPTGDVSLRASPHDYLAV